MACWSELRQGANTDSALWGFLDSSFPHYLKPELPVRSLQLTSPKSRISFKLHSTIKRPAWLHYIASTTVRQNRAIGFFNMVSLSLAGTTLVAFEHIYIMVLEMFLWTTPRGRKAFNLTPEYANQTRAMAANQGLYNGFLAAGLLWAVVHPDQQVSKQLGTFFLGCVVAAGLFGAATVNKRIFFMQGLPATISLCFTLLDL